MVFNSVSCTGWSSIHPLWKNVCLVPVLKFFVVVVIDLCELFIYFDIKHIYVVCKYCLLFCFLSLLFPLLCRRFLSLVFVFVYLYIFTFHCLSFRYSTQKFTTKTNIKDLSYVFF